MFLLPLKFQICHRCFVFHIPLHTVPAVDMFSKILRRKINLPGSQLATLNTQHPACTHIRFQFYILPENGGIIYRPQQSE